MRNGLSPKFYAAWGAILTAVAIGLAYYAARNWNPTRPYIGEPTAKHFDFFARRYNNLACDSGNGYVDYKAELKRTDSLTFPLVGEFVGVRPSGRTQLIRFAWQDGRWVDMTYGQNGTLANEAQGIK